MTFSLLAPPPQTRPDEARPSDACPLEARPWEAQLDEACPWEAHPDDVVDTAYLTSESRGRYDLGSAPTPASTVGVPDEPEGVTDAPPEEELDLIAGYAAHPASVIRSVTDDDGPAVDPACDRIDGDTHLVVGGGDGSLRGQIRDLAAAAARVRSAAWSNPIGGGELAGLVELLDVVDTVQGGVFGLMTRILQDRVVQRTQQLDVVSWLALATNLDADTQRRLLRNTTTLRFMPCLSLQIMRGTLPASLVNTITVEARRGNAAGREAIDELFREPDPLRERTSSELVDRVRQAADEHDRRRVEQEHARDVENRHLSLRYEGGQFLTGYLELDPEGSATLTAALQAAAPTPSSGPKDVTAHAVDGVDDGPAVPDSWSNRARGRQQADALVRICEAYLGSGGRVTDGTTTDPAAAASAAPSVSTSGRARPRLLVWVDIDQLTGDTTNAHAARLLWTTNAGTLRLTPGALRRITSDATLRFILHDNGRILGTTDPTPTIPTALRDAVIARDHTCRFPGCTAPAAWLDLHHVTPREHGGPTTPDNLVALCRRHHTAITTGAWKLTMTPDGTVTVTRGRRRYHSAAPSRPSPRPPP